MVTQDHEDCFLMQKMIPVYRDCSVKFGKSLKIPIIRFQLNLVLAKGARVVRPTIFDYNISKG